jgi:hypothetical protein
MPLPDCFVVLITAIGLLCSPASASASDSSNVAVPERSAALIRPILDLRQQSIAECGELGSNSNCASGAAYERQQDRDEKIWELVVALTQRSGPQADEALVVLTCFNLDVAHETSDAIVDRGRRMLPLIDKYHRHRPVVPNRNYPGVMLRSDADAQLDAAVRLINYGSGPLRETTARPLGEGYAARSLLR